MLAKLLGHVLGRRNESPVVFAKCAFYHGMLQRDIGALERQFDAFAQRLFEVEERAESRQVLELNTLCVVYGKPAEAFTKDLNYFKAQRSAD